MSDFQLTLQAQELLAREARALDLQQWDEWLALLSEDCVFWMPAWKSEFDLSSDPDTELSLFYYESKHDLADRAWRLDQQKSVASSPILRTSHATNNVLCTPGAAGRATISASWTVQTFNPKRNVCNTFFGRVEYEVDTSTADWKIVKKKSILMNDYIPTMMDFYCC